MRRHRPLLPIIIAFFALSARAAMAQSTIFNVPTTDTVEKGKVYSEFDWLAQDPNTRGLDRLHILNSRVMVGITNNIDIGGGCPACS